MQNKGKLAALLSSVIAVLLILVCAFYLSFTIVNSNYETAATDYAHVQSQGKENQDQAYKICGRNIVHTVGMEYTSLEDNKGRRKICAYVVVYLGFHTYDLSILESCFIYTL